MRRRVREETSSKPRIPTSRRPDFNLEGIGTNGVCPAVFTILVAIWLAADFRGSSDKMGIARRRLAPVLNPRGGREAAQVWQDGNARLQSLPH